MAEKYVTEVLDFWQTAGPAAWWRKDLKFDEEIRTRFGELHQSATSRKLDDWRSEPKSCLALVLLLDQFSRNLFRGSDKTFAQDDYGLELAKHAIANEYDKGDPKELTGFFYLPYMHSENIDDQEICVELFRKTGNERSIEAAIEHRDIIAKFGRFPHRNKVLGRKTSVEEQAFLDDGGFSG